MKNKLIIKIICSYLIIIGAFLGIQSLLILINPNMHSGIEGVLVSLCYFGLIAGAISILLKKTGGKALVLIPCLILMFMGLFQAFLCVGRSKEICNPITISLFSFLVFGVPAFLLLREIKNDNI